MWQEKLVDVLQVASIVAAAGFAAFALFTEFKKDGRITKYGRMAVAGIVLSAIFSLATQWGKDEIDRSRTARQQEEDRARELEAQRAAAAELERYRVQIDRLDSLSDRQGESLEQSRDLAQRMGVSLDQQLALQSQVRTTLAAVDATRNQEQANTGRVLHTMWDDANRIDGSRLSLTVTYRCAMVSGGEDFPLLLARDTVATIRVTPMAAAREQRLAFKAFASKPLLDVGRGVEFQSTDQRVSVSRAKSVDGDDLVQTSGFAQFETSALGDFGHPDAWRDIAVEVMLRGYQGGVVGRAAKLMPDAGPVGGKEDLAETFALADAAEASDYRIAVLPCMVDMNFAISGRRIASALGKLVQVSEWDEDVRGLAVVRFPIVPGYGDAFPTFAVAD